MEVSFPTAVCLGEEPRQVGHIQLLRKDESLQSYTGNRVQMGPGAGPVSRDSAHLVVLLLKMLCSGLFFLILTVAGEFFNKKMQ